MNQLVRSFDYTLKVAGEQIPFKVVHLGKARYAVVDGWWDHVDYVDLMNELQKSFQHSGQVIIDRKEQDMLRKLAHHRKIGITLRLYL